MRNEGSMHAPSPSGRRRIAAKSCLAISAALVALFAATELRHVMPGMNQDGFSQTLRQSAWSKALSDQSAVEAWPWQNASVRMSHMPSATVRRLGLSASLRDTADAWEEPQSGGDENRALAHTSPGATSTDGDIALGDVGSGEVGIGDSITFTANDGATCSYRVTGRPVVDPHLDSGAAEGAQGQAGLFDCSPLDSLIMRASQQAREAAPQAPAIEHQHKL